MAVDIRKRLPDVSRISIPFQWVPTKVLMDLPAADFWGESLNDPAEGECDCGDPAHTRESGDTNADSKRADSGYVDLLESIERDGWVDPVYVDDATSGGDGGMRRYTGSDRALGNGHHRVVCAVDLGYTHVPVTFDPTHQWESNEDVCAH